MVLIQAGYCVSVRKKTVWYTWLSNGAVNPSFESSFEHEIHGVITVILWHPDLPHRVVVDRTPLSSVAEGQDKMQGAKERDI